MSRAYRCPMCRARQWWRLFRLRHKIEAAKNGPRIVIAPMDWVNLLDDPCLKTADKLQEHEYLAGAVGAINGSLIFLLPKEPLA